ncbi:kinase-like protein [Gonapodya prolifera JEL478]|uniref:Kinase-like protein n=1 Tax=Gonapodya prolifera (strain JEL478) TaxID=1344416 RepID=A0A139A3M8_GONPJ|nr:kinase-like protein [Gonapodya prolifera JEL478]|eukprot:KXS11269.1 kinase-like protein [Gonapodya prolifera JEL478]
MGAPGAFGFVRKAYLKSDPSRTPYVIKHCHRSSIAASRYSSDPELGKVPIEIVVLDKIRKDPQRSAYVAHLVDFFADEKYFYVVMPCLGSADLFDYVEMYLGKGSHRIPEGIVRHIFKQVVEGVAYLHAKGIVHRDIKDENVIVSDNLDVTIVDFGSAAFYGPGVNFTTFCGTLDYASPEVLEGNTYRGPEQDIWALGILFHILLFSENPFRDVAEITSKELRFPYQVSEQAFELLNWMLQRDPGNRPSAEEVVGHEFFNDTVIN